MDFTKTVEDEFSKLHPCFPVDTRVAIVGAGPSGLSAAYALVKLGYRNITVLEKHHTVGGMCESVDIEGKHSLITICHLSLPWHLHKVNNNFGSIVFLYRKGL